MSEWLYHSGGICKKSLLHPPSLVADSELIKVKILIFLLTPFSLCQETSSFEKTKLSMYHFKTLSLLNFLRFLSEELFVFLFYKGGKQFREVQPLPLWLSHLERRARLSCSVSQAGAVRAGWWSPFPKGASCALASLQVLSLPFPFPGSFQKLLPTLLSVWICLLGFLPPSPTVSVSDSLSVPPC